MREPGKEIICQTNQHGMMKFHYCKEVIKKPTENYIGLTYIYLIQMCRLVNMLERRLVVGVSLHLPAAPDPRLPTPPVPG